MCYVVQLCSVHYSAPTAKLPSSQPASKLAKAVRMNGESVRGDNVHYQIGEWIFILIL